MISPETDTLRAAPSGTNSLPFIEEHFLSKRGCDIVCFWDRGDLDGRCSLEIVRRFASRERLRRDPFDASAEPVKEAPGFRAVGYRYGDNVADVVRGIPAGTIVFVVDTCLPLDLMEELLKARTLVWIDHHRSAIEGATARQCGLSATAGVRWATEGKNDPSACELTWSWCFPGEVTPYAVRLLGRWDVWDHGFHEDVADFQAAMLHVEPDYPWQELLGADQARLKPLLDGGKVVRRVFQKQNEKSAAMCGTLEWRGICFAVLNTCFSGSKQAELYALARPHISAILTWRWDAKAGYFLLGFYNVPGREVGIDLLALVRELDPATGDYPGGGGHPGACGCRVMKLPFEVYDVRWEGSLVAAASN